MVPSRPAALYDYDVRSFLPQVRLLVKQSEKNRASETGEILRSSAEQIQERTCQEAFFAIRRDAVNIFENRRVYQLKRLEDEGKAFFQSMGAPTGGSEDDKASYTIKRPYAYYEQVLKKDRDQSALVKMSRADQEKQMPGRVVQVFVGDTQWSYDPGAPTIELERYKPDANGDPEFVPAEGWSLFSAPADTGLEFCCPQFENIAHHPSKIRQYVAV